MHAEPTLKISHIILGGKKKKNSVYVTLPSWEHKLRRGGRRTTLACAATEREDLCGRVAARGLDWCRGLQVTRPKQNPCGETLTAAPPPKCLAPWANSWEIAGWTTHISCVCVCVRVCACVRTVEGSIKKQLCPIRLQALQHYSPLLSFLPLPLL